MADAALGPLVHRLSGVYRDPQRVLRDAGSLLRSPLGAHLRPTTEPLILNDGTSTPPVLLLRGTIPHTYRGVTYNLPVDLYLPPPYPSGSPTVFIRPVASMAIKENHKHVGLDGRVYLPYLHEWRANTHDLTELIVWMSSLFGAEPPCYARPAGGRTSRPPPYAQASVATASATPVTSSASPASFGSSAVAASSFGSSAASSFGSSTTAASQRSQADVAREVAEANLAAEAARRADAEEARAAAEEARAKAEEGRRLASLRVQAASKVRSELTSLYAAMREELRTDLRDQKLLEAGRREIEDLIEDAGRRKAELARANEDMDGAIDELSTWLEGVREDRTPGDGDTDGGDDGGADRLALPSDVHSAQMLALSAESAAIDDCVYHLDRALARGGLTLDAYLKEVRRLGKRQFMAKAHLIKIGQVRAAAAS